MTGTVKEIIEARRRAGEGAYLYLRFNSICELYESEETYTARRSAMRSWELDAIERDQLIETGLVDEVGVLGCTGGSTQEIAEKICLKMLEGSDPADPTLFERITHQLTAAGIELDQDATERARDESPNVIAVYKEDDSDEGRDYIEVVDGKLAFWGYNGKIDAELMTLEQIQHYYENPPVTAEDLAGLRFIEHGNGQRFYDGADIDAISISKTAERKARMEERRSVTLTLPGAFLELCEDVNETPASILESFIADLCGMDGPSPYITSGSDERMFAQEYFDRCGYRWRAKMDREEKAKGKG